MRGLKFGYWFVNVLNGNHDLVRLILWSNKSNLSNRSMFNRKNYLSNENLMQNIPCNPRISFSIKVWCGLIKKKLLEQYHNRWATTWCFLRNTLDDVLDDISLADWYGIFLIKMMHLNTILEMWTIHLVFHDDYIAKRWSVLRLPYSRNITATEF